MPPANPTEGRNVFTVSAIAARIKGVVESSFESVWVSGEISNLTKHSSGHIYFSLKDSTSSIKAALFRGVGWRLRFEPGNGMEVLARGRVGIYESRSEYQLVVEELQPQGIGPLELAFQQLKDQLTALDYFNPRRKKPLPKLPRTIAIVTSPTGAAIRDMLEILSRRWPCAQVYVIPVRVQGDGVSGEIAQAIRALNNWHRLKLVSIDALIVGRGGGSLEDLWAFNERPVADAVFESVIPVISAVGHETDVTICDHVADHRALTPSHAIMDLTPDRMELQAALRTSANRLDQGIRRHLERLRIKLTSIGERRAFRLPLDRFRERTRRLDELGERLTHASQRLIKLKQDRLAATASRLESLSPLNILSRGYSLTQDADGQVIRQANSLKPGDLIRTRLAQGELMSRVISEENPE